MTKDEILNMPAGKELDDLVAEKVMGWHKASENNFRDAWNTLDGHYQCSVSIYDFEDGEDFHTICWHPSESILWAWQVVEKMQERGYCFDADGNAQRKRIRFGVGNEIGEADTMSLAICRAAVLAVLL